MWKIPFRDLIALQEARVKQLKEESDAMTKAAEERKSQNIRDTIMSKS